MPHREENPMRREELLALPVNISVPTAAKALGISRAHGYTLAKRGELGVRVLRLGTRWVVVTAELLAHSALSTTRIGSGDDA